MAIRKGSEYRWHRWMRIAKVSRIFFNSQKEIRNPNGVDTKVVILAFNNPGKKNREIELGLGFIGLILSIDVAI